MTRFPMMRAALRWAIVAGLSLPFLAVSSPSDATERAATPMLEQVSQGAVADQTQAVRRILVQALAAKPGNAVKSMPVSTASEATDRRN